MTIKQPARRSLAVAALGVLSCCAVGLPLRAQAQTQVPAKPPVRAGAAAAPAAAASARGFGNARGPLLTRDELRVCLTQEDDLKKRIERHEAARAPLEQDKKQITEEQAVLRGERTRVEGTDPAVASFTERGKAFAERLARWSERVKAFTEAGRTGSTAERERDALNAEREDLEKERTALDAVRARLQAARQEAVQAYNVKVNALDARGAEWKKRETAYNDAGTALDGERQSWVASCGNRRYREEDEIAIRSGK